MGGGAGGRQPSLRVASGFALRRLGATRPKTSHAVACCALRLRLRLLDGEGPPGRSANGPHLCADDGLRPPFGSRSARSQRPSLRPFADRGPSTTLCDFAALRDGCALRLRLRLLDVVPRSVGLRPPPVTRYTTQTSLAVARCALHCAALAGWRGSPGRSGNGPHLVDDDGRERPPFGSRCARSQHPSLGPFADRGPSTTLFRLRRPSGRRQPSC